MSKGWRVTFVHGDHLHVMLVGIENEDEAKVAAIGDRTAVSDVIMEEIDDISRFDLVEGEVRDSRDISDLKSALFGVQREVGQRALAAARRLVQHHPRVRQHQPAAGLPAASSTAAEEPAWPIAVVPTGELMNCSVS